MSLSDKIEDRQDALLAEQEASRDKLRAILVAAMAAVGELDFPLGSPVRGYDKSDIMDQLADMTPGLGNQPASHALREVAYQKAQDELGV